MTAAAESRSVPSRLAGVVEALELDQPRVVTVADLEGLARSSGLSISGVALGYQLRRLGWLLPLRTRGVWEFAPAARAGRYSAGDRHIELRAARISDTVGLIPFDGSLHPLAVKRDPCVPGVTRPWIYNLGRYVCADGVASAGSPVSIVSRPALTRRSMAATASAIDARA